MVHLAVKRGTSQDSRASAASVHSSSAFRLAGVRKPNTQVTDKETIKELRDVLRQVMEDCERAKEVFGCWTLSVKTIALIEETLAHG